MRLQGAAVPLRRLSKPRNPGVAARSTGLSAVAPVPISPLPQPLQRPELARGHESEKKVSQGLSSIDLDFVAHDRFHREAALSFPRV